MTQPGAVTGRLWRGYADVRRRLARTGSATVPSQVFGDSRADVERWNQLTRDRHVSYRRQVETPDDTSGVVCVTNRPSRLLNISDNLLRQRHRPGEVVVVLNSTTFEAESVDVLEAVLGEAGMATQVLEHPDLTLGACLNRALAATNARYVAKFDDDDRYGAGYLQDALRAHSYAGAGVVGKHTHFVSIEATGDLLIRFPGREYTYSGTLAGGTLVIDRDRTGSLSFPDVSLGEDRGFLYRCHRRGISTFAADRFNYVLHRGVDNTWSIPESVIADASVRVGGNGDLTAAEI